MKIHLIFKCKILLRTSVLFVIFLQAIALGIQFDYKKDYRRLWQINFVCILFSLLSVASSYDTYLFCRQIMPSMDFVDFFVPVIFQNFILVQISTTYTILLRCLHIRFSMLNKCFRYSNRCFIF